MCKGNFVTMLKTAKKSSLIGIGISLTFMLVINGPMITPYLVIGFIIFGIIVGFFISLANNLIHRLLFLGENNNLILQLIISYIISFIVFYIIALPFAYIGSFSKVTLLYASLATGLASMMISLFFMTLGEKEERIKLEQDNKELAIIEERNRIARELHDSVSQNLFGINLNLNTLNYLLEHNPEKSQEMIKHLQEMVQEVQTEMRLMIYGLKPLDLTEREFLEAIENLISLFKRRYNLTILFSVIGDTNFINNKVQLTLYRVLQESLNNIVKHAQADKIEISLEIKEDNIQLSIQDNGRGFNLQEVDKDKSFGLEGMKERIKYINGSLAIESTIGEGTIIKAII
ncbi:Signal transduction histidine kinase [Orenia metallireducens]|uniref:histidine kinase n=1 Tax=Orenia metallireducens TaxID=1413210 RepID=A0A285G0V0_9FIRM|nr:sensor histidine kinase [Orenia metallireducens]SNY17038.1 Signal transduction histidine kinase [Orenia metallireducens]